MTRPVPVAFRWCDVDVIDADGVVRTRPAMVPLHRFEKVCERQFGEPGGMFILAPDEHASDRSRRHFFACLKEGWRNLPESIAHRFPSPEHLRKAALVKAGFRKERHHVCPNYKDALLLALTFKDVDEFCVTVIHKGTTEADPATLSIYTAESQSTFAMKADRFQESKTAVLGLIAGLIGTTLEELKRNAKEGDQGDEQRNPDHSLEREATGKPVEGPGRRSALPPPQDGSATGAGAAAAAGAKNGDQA